MVHLGGALHLGRLVRIIGSDAEVEHEAPVSVEALVGRDDQLEVEQVIGIGKVCGASVWQVQFVNIWGMKGIQEMDD